MNEPIAWPDALSAVTTFIVAAVGGLWAYWRFIRGRTFGARGQCTVTATFGRHEPLPILNVTVEFKNLGAQRLRVLKGVDQSAIEVWCATPKRLISQSRNEDEFQWEKFDSHERAAARLAPPGLEIDPGEVAVYATAVRLAPMTAAAKVVVYVSARRDRWWGLTDETHKWYSEAVVFARGEGARKQDQSDE